MKKHLAFILALVICLSLCACSSSQDKEIIECITQGKWYSYDRNVVHKVTDTWTVVVSDYWYVFYEDGSYKGGHTDTDYGHLNEVEYSQHTGTWIVEDGYIILDRGNPHLSEKKYTLKDGVLYAPAAEGYSYHQVIE